MDKKYLIRVILNYELKTIKLLNKKDFLDYSNGYFIDEYICVNLAQSKSDYLNYYESILNEYDEQELLEILENIKER